MGARREVMAPVARRYPCAGRAEKVRILDELTAMTGWSRKHAVQAQSVAGRKGPDHWTREETGQTNQRRIRCTRRVFTPIKPSDRFRGCRSQLILMPAKYRMSEACRGSTGPSDELPPDQGARADHFNRSICGSDVGFVGLCLSRAVTPL